MGKRGEGWVIIQLMLLVFVLCMPRIGSIEFPLWLRLLGGLIIVVAGVVVVTGIRALGRSLTPFPRPVIGGCLVTDGIYGLVRHPLYMAGIFATFGWGLLTANLLVIGMVAVVFLFFDLKSRREEIWLIGVYPGYANYRRRVKKLIPWIY